MAEAQQSGVVDEEGTSGAVEVSALLAHDIDHVWRVLTTNDGAAALLGDGAQLGSKGEHWRASDGTHGVWRSYHPMEQVRVSWHASEDAPRALVDLHLEPAGDRTAVSVRHEPVEGDREALVERWTAALARIDALAGD
ncbi:MAG: SRPBCC domain-containing protein [Dermatophilaceae bacterium]